MTRLLVSVRNADEARAALAGGADLIDIKEPSNGALGAADPSVWRDVLAAINGRVPVSAALGELKDEAWRALIEHAHGLAFVKAGLANASADFDWRAAYAELRERLPIGTNLVAVAYADHLHADAPHVHEVLDAAIALRLPALLIDTFDKTRGDLWSALASPALEHVITRAHRAQVQVAIAGSLSLSSFNAAADLAPDWLAVRGAACLGGRDGVVAADLVAALKTSVKTASQNRQSMRADSVCLSRISHQEIS
jgi:uncharacterized protein (UPF0264 family)